MSGAKETHHVSDEGDSKLFAADGPSQPRAGEGPHEVRFAGRDPQNLRRLIDRNSSKIAEFDQFDGFDNRGIYAPEGTTNVWWMLSC